MRRVPRHGRSPRSAMQVSRSFLVSGQEQQIFLGFPSGPMGTPGGAGVGDGSAAGMALLSVDCEAPMELGAVNNYCKQAHCEATGEGKRPGQVNVALSR